MKLKYLIISFVFFFFGSNLFAQNGLKFAELAERLKPYFPDQLILDIKKELPYGSDYSVWGWDVGDFSGDGHTDVAFTIRLKADRKKTVQVYFFVNIDGYLTKVGQFAYEFFEIPLEIGVAIRHNACYVTKKIKKFNWLIRGYTFDNGSLIQLDEFRTERVGKLTNESYENYLTLNGTEKYLYSTDGTVEFSANYLKIPAYKRGRQVYKGYSDEAFSYQVDYVHKGAFWWQGQTDASFSVKAAYDSRYLYMSVDIQDENIVVADCDTCPGDYLEVWFDVMPPYLDIGDRFAYKKNGRLHYRTSSELGIYSFKFFPGDFLDEKPFVKIATTDDLEKFQVDASQNIKVVSSTSDQGMILKFKIPFTMMGFDEAPVFGDEPTELGCSVVYNDIDNKYRPEEGTEIASSAFSALNPSTYGSIMLIPDGVWWGNADNIYQPEILKQLGDYGY